MANRKQSVARGTFGSAPVLGELPSIKGLNDDVAMLAAIGTIGGNMQWMVASTLFFFGSMAKEKGEKYNGSKAWDAYYAKSGLNYTNKDTLKNTKSNAIVYAEFAQLKKWDTQELAGRIFEYPHGSQGQKAAAIRKVMEKHADKAPSEEELDKLLPKKKKDTEDRDPSLKAKAKGLKTTIAGIREDETLLEMIESNERLNTLFEGLETAASKFFDMAETIEKKAKASAELAAANKAAGLKKDKPEAGARLN